LTDTVFDDKSFYFSIPEDEEESTGCTYTYALQMADGSDVPSYYTFDTETGALEFSNIASRVIYDEIQVQISATDNVESRILTFGDGYPYVQTTDSMLIETWCGEESTTITKPEDLSPEQAMDSDANFIFEAVFTSSNPRCPIVANIIETDSTFLAFTDNGADGFSISLDDSRRKVQGDNYFMVIGIAEGEAYAQAFGSMKIEETELNLPAVIGGAVGGVVFLIIVAIGVCFCMRAKIDNIEIEPEVTVEHHNGST
jgi:hypothetical protein